MSESSKPVRVAIAGYVLSMHFLFNIYNSISYCVLLFFESNYSTQFSVVALLAKNVLSHGQWPELFALLVQLVQHADEGFRTLCFDLLCQVLIPSIIIFMLSVFIFEQVFFAWLYLFV